MHGILDGIRVVEMGGIGPGPFACMMLADQGAEVIRVERRGADADIRNPMLRSRLLVSLNLKDSADVAKLRDLVARCDVFVDVFRPGVLERLGLGPDVLLQDNPRLVYARMTGWGQTGPFAQHAGHDLNYISVTGAAHAIGPPERPVPPLALIGDYGGGGMMLAFAILAAHLHALRTGSGQVVDCAMCDGANLLMTQTFGLHSIGLWSERRGENILDGGAPFYMIYRTADDRFISIAAIEPQFYSQLLQRLGLEKDPLFAEQLDQTRWPAMRARLEQIFLERTRAQWCQHLQAHEVCFAPVLSFTEAPGHPQAVERKMFVSIDGVVQPAPAPRFTACEAREAKLPASVDIDELLARLPRRDAP